MTRGLLAGRSYAVGERYSGVWGLYGSYDYIAPQTYRVASTAFSGPACNCKRGLSFSRTVKATSCRG